MAEVEVETRYINDCLADLLQMVNRAIAWTSKNAGEKVTLEIPEPFDHPVRDHKPSTVRVCLAQDPILEECSDIGILMGVLDAMRKPRRKTPRAKGRPKPAK